MSVSALVTTPGSATANSYCSLAVADQYHEDRPAAGTTWSTATSAQKNAALLWATKLLDRYFVWHGSVVDVTQKLLWPRAGLADVNEWTVLSTTAIPELIQFATAEFARQLLASDMAGDSDIEAQRITSIRAGSVGLTFGSGVTAKHVPDAVVNLIPARWGHLRGSGVRTLERA